MIVSLIKGTKINNLRLPEKIKGSFWVKDYDINNIEQNIINIEASTNGWKMISNEDVTIISNNEERDSIILNDYSFYILKINQTNNLILIYCAPSFDKTFNRYIVDNGISISIGSKETNNIYYDNYGVDKEHAKIEYDNGNYYIVDNDSRLGTYVNNIRVRHQQKLTNGDIIFITGLKIIMLMDKDKILFVINNPDNTVIIDKNIFIEKEVKKINPNYYDDTNDKDELSFEELYKHEDYFHKKSRKKKDINKVTVHIDAPPEIKKNIPFIYNLIPIFTVLVILMLIGISIIVNTTLTIPTFILSLVILIIMFTWYLGLNKKFIENEEKTKGRYINYIKLKQKKIKKEIEKEKQILLENNLSLEECQKTILKHKPFLWERKLNDNEFLNINLGLGTLPVSIKIDYPNDHIDNDDEILDSLINELNNDYKYLNDVPISLNLIDNYVLGLIGTKKLNKKYIDRLILQLISYHSYDDLKIVLLTTKNNESSWEYIKILPHIWNNDRTIRYFGCNEEEINNICSLLQDEYNKNIKENNYDNHYLIITDNYRNIKNYSVVKNILKNENNGFELIILNDNLSNLPNECKSYIEVSEKESTLYNENISFEIDYDTPINMYECSKELANIPLDVNIVNNIPNKYELLEMFNVGTIEQLNSYNRWLYNNPVLSLKADIGIGNSGEKIKLDIHESNHGPNGIITGSNGSGKTNTLITYILSMAINYHPKEVQFILIDQENGELVNTFDNKELCIKLPHLVGTITNYEDSELDRVLLSLNNELNRRKEIFNDIKDYVGDINLDIYKYQQLYRQNKVKESLSHLIIVVDKYEELKYISQQFIRKINNIVRNGRIYGLHIICSSTDIVEDDIYSNSRFKINLNMKDGLDRVDNEYLLDKLGRFYLQVGNSIKSFGQVAYSKGNYYPHLKHKKEINTSLDFIDNIGSIYLSNDKNKNIEDNAQGIVLNNILMYLSNIKNKERIKVKELWLDNIPSIITVSSLIRKYDLEKNIIIGEYDDPNNRLQNVLSYNMNNSSIIYSRNNKELIINSILYSSMKLFNTNELNYYILDFNKELLTSFKDNPLVGNIIVDGEDDKIYRLFNLINKKIEERKQLISIYGDINIYNKNSDEKLPIINVIINNYDQFISKYNYYQNNIYDLIKISNKYGINFIITSSSPKNISFSLKQHIDTIYTLDISNEEYISLYNKSFDKANNIKGRGLTIIDNNIYEFQTAIISKDKDDYEHIRNRCLDFLKISDRKVEEIPTLPDKITFKDIKKEIANEIIIGYNKYDLSITTYDFNKTVNIITGKSIKLLSQFTSPLIKQFSALNKSDLIVIDASGENIIKSSANIKLVNSSYNDNFINLEKFINEYYEKYLNNSIRSNARHTTIFICGIDKFINELSESNKNRVKELFNKEKEIGIINIVIVDSIINIEKYENDLWYNLVDNTNGIWVGNGISEQFSIRINKITKELCEDIPDNYCYTINKGEVTLSQYVENYSVAE